MADWYGSARTNYFRVKDETRFRKWAESAGDMEVVKDDEGRVALLSQDEHGGWPGWRYNQETEEEEDLDLFQEVAEHLLEGSVAVFIEVGAEKLRYLTGRAVAVNASGQIVAHSLDQIYELAKSLGDEITLAEG